MSLAAAEALRDLRRLVDAEEELQDCLVGDATDDDHRDGDHLKHVGGCWPEGTVAGVTDPHCGATHIRCDVQQEHDAGHHDCRDVLGFQLSELDTRLAEVPEGNLDTTGHGTEHEAHEECMSPADVPSKERHVEVEGTGHVGFECTLEVVGTCGNVKVQESWTKNDTDERFP